MGLTILKKWVWVLLFFSLALNIGFIYGAANRKSQPPGFHRPPGPGPVVKILDRIDLPDEAREKVTESFTQLHADHRKYVRLLFAQERKILDLIGKPGKLDMEMIAPLIETCSQLTKKSAMQKARYILEIRALLGPENSLFLISEIKKDFSKRRPKGKWPD